MIVYTAAAGDMIDAIIARHFGIASDYGAMTETLRVTLELNPHAIPDPVLAAGTEIKLPDAPVSKEPTDRVRLWD